MRPTDFSEAQLLTMKSRDGEPLADWIVREVPPSYTDLEGGRWYEGTVVGSLLEKRECQKPGYDPAAFLAWLCGADSPFRSDGNDDT